METQSTLAGAIDLILGARERAAPTHTSGERAACPISGDSATSGSRSVAVELEKGTRWIRLDQDNRYINRILLRHHEHCLWREYALWTGE